MLDHTELSDREREILELVATGASNKEIALRLSISANTVKVHLRNIFAKTGVVSRTEATLYALRQGVVQLDGAKENATVRAAASEPVDAAVPLATPLPLVLPVRRLGRRLLWALPAILLVVGASVLSIARQPTTPAAASPVVPTAASRWQSKASLPLPRMSLASAIYENRIYTVGGETAQGVSSATERFNPADNTWTSLAPKPLAVTQANAVVVGGRIYVPGGRVATGETTDRLDVYDPRQDRWEQRASLPAALCGSSAVALEGKLYLFGGWNGQRVVSTVYEYDPVRDVWLARTDMPTARAYSGAAVSGNRIYVVGGYDGTRPLSVNEEYLPNADGDSETAWSQRAPLPSGRYAMGAASVAGLVFVVGGQGNKGERVFPVQYMPQQDKWQSVEAPLAEQWTHLALVATDTHLYALGGGFGGTPTAHNASYQAIYTIIVPALR